MGLWRIAPDIIEFENGDEEEEKRKKNQKKTKKKKKKMAFNGGRGHDAIDGADAAVSGVEGLMSKIFGSFFI